jgi:hypothetical protein
VTLAYAGSSQSTFQIFVYFTLLTSFQRISPSPRLCEMLRNLISFYGEELLAHSPTTKLEDHSLSVIRDDLFNIFADVHIWRPHEDAPCHGDKCIPYWFIGDCNFHYVDWLMEWRSNKL